MNILKTYHPSNRIEWRAWLKKHYKTESEVWLVYYKKHTSKPNIAYDDAVEEALCFGWIDSIIQKIDNDKYARKFTPRKKNSKWSALNKTRVIKMIKAGRMTNAGKAVLNFSGAEDDYGRTPEHTADLLKPPSFLQQVLLKNHKAGENFQKLAPSYRRQYIAWLSAAKTKETRNKRIKEAISLLIQNKKLGLK